MCARGHAPQPRPRPDRGAGGSKQGGRELPPGARTSGQTEKKLGGDECSLADLPAPCWCINPGSTGIARLGDRECMTASLTLPPFFALYFFCFRELGQRWVVTGARAGLGRSAAELS